MKTASTPPPPLNRMHEGAACVFPLSRERGYFWPQSRVDFPRKPGRGGVFVITNDNQYPRQGVYNFPRDRGVRVMGNEHRYPLVRQEGGGAVFHLSSVRQKLGLYFMFYQAFNSFVKIDFYYQYLFICLFVVVVVFVF